MASASIAFLDSCSEHNPGFREGEFTNKQGLVLRTYDKQPEPGKKKADVVLMHGFKAHALFEFLLAEAPGGRHKKVEGSLLDSLVKDGFGVWMFDCQGHGLSQAVDGCVTFFERFSDLIDDFLLFVSLVRSPSTPLFTCGCSMGGGIVVGAARKQPDHTDGMVLFAPMLSLEHLARTPLNRVLLNVGEAASRWLPKVPLAKMEKNVMFPMAWEEFVRDPLIDSSLFSRARVGWEVYLFASDVINHLDEITTPFLTFHSANDTMVDLAASERLFSDARSESKRFERVDSMYHSLLSEDGKEKVIEATVAWLNERAK